MVLRGSKTAPDGSMQDAMATHQQQRQQQQNNTRRIQTDLDRVLKQLAAGGLAGAIARTVVAPLDRVKILMQTQRLLQTSEIAPAAASSTTSSMASTIRSAMPRLPQPPPALAFPVMQPAVSSSIVPTISIAPSLAAQPPVTIRLGSDKYTAMFQTMKLIMREEGGLLSLWRGNLTNILRVMPYSAIQFASYDYLKSEVLARYQREPPKMNNFERLGCGAGAGMIATALTYPLDLVRLRQTVDPTLKGLRGASKQILKESGSKGMWQGLGATMWSLTPFIAINFATFDGLKSYVGGCPQPAAMTLSIGALSGLFAQTICYPLDTVRRRMQLPNQPYRSVGEACARMVREEGVRVFYAGMGANAAKVVPLAAIRFLAYEQIKKFLE